MCEEVYLQIYIKRKKKKKKKPEEGFKKKANTELKNKAFINQVGPLFSQLSEMKIFGILGIIFKRVCRGTQGT